MWINEQGKKAWAAIIVSNISMIRLNELNLNHITAVVPITSKLLRSELKKIKLRDQMEKST